MAVDRCICHNLRFSDLFALARREALDAEALSARTGCGTGCGLCVPYIVLMLQTGRTDFPVLPSALAAQLRAQAPKITPSKVFRTSPFNTAG